MKEAVFIYENLKRKLLYSTQRKGAKIIFDIKIADINLAMILPDYFKMEYNEISKEFNWNVIVIENVFTKHKIKHEITDQILKHLVS